MKLRSRSGKTIKLRTVRKGDEKILYEFAKELEEEDTFILLNPSEPVTWEEEVEYVANMAKKVAENKLVYLMAFDGERLVGTCQVGVEGKRQRHVGSLGISLRKEYRSDGIGSQLVAAAIEEAKERLKIEQVVLDCFANNEVACAMYKKAGFEEYGRRPEAVEFKGERVDKVLFYKKV